MIRNQWFAGTLVAMVVPALGLAAKPDSGTKVTYQYSRHGEANAKDVSTTPLVVLSGGGTDVLGAFKQMCVANNGGDFLVLGTSTFNKNYFSYIRNACIDAGKPANSVSVLIVPDAAAAKHPFVSETISQAETIWIAGGDQSDYVSFWGNSPMQTALNRRIQEGAVIGGISAGLNVLTEFVYTAQGSSTVTSSLALANPNSESITLIQNFVSVHALEGLIGDPHFAARDRMGRDLAFLYRIFNQFTSTVARGVSVDEGTAVIISRAKKTWTAEVIGTGNTYVLQPTKLPSTLSPDSPLDGVEVDVFRVGPGGQFDLSKWSGAHYSVSAVNGVLSSTQAGNSIY